MDKAAWLDTIKDVRLVVQRLTETVNEIDEYLVRLHNELAWPEINESMRTKDEVTQEEINAAMVSQQEVEHSVRLQDVTGDPRYPYLAGRQPRRDGDSYDTVPAPHKAGDPYGTKAALERQRRRTQDEETRPHYPRVVQSPPRERR